MRECSSLSRRRGGAESAEKAFDSPLLRVSAMILLAFTLHAQPAPCDNTPAWSACEITFELSGADAAAYPNPYNTVELRADFRSPQMRSMSLPAYWDGGNRFVFRFAPGQSGRWQYHLTSNVASLEGKEGSFNAAESESPGFIHPANVHHWAFVAHSGPLTQAHLWMAAGEPRFPHLDDAGFRAMADERAAAKFTHVRGVVLGDGTDAAFTSAGLPDVKYFQRLDDRVRYLNQKGMIADLTIASDPAALVKLFPTAAGRRRLTSFLVGRYAGFNVTWQVFGIFEGYPGARALAKEVGGYLKEMDGYQHPRTCGAKVTSGPLLDDGWMNFAGYGTPDEAVGAIEHQLYQAPAVNRIADTDPVALRHHLWEATMNGQYPECAGLTGASAKFMSVWFEFMNATRHWDVEPYFDVDGGRALALPGVEYIVYIEKPGPVELSVEHHGYEVFWVDPADGSTTRGKYSGEHFTGEPPDRYHDWVLHVVREGTLSSMNRSYKFDSWDVPVQEIVINPEKIPYDIEKPAGDLTVGKPAEFAAKLKRSTRGTRNMMWMWTGEVTGEGEGYRVLGSGQQGSLTVPTGLASNYPTDILLRVYGINGYGAVYMLAKGYSLKQ